MTSRTTNLEDLIIPINTSKTKTASNIQSIYQYARVSASYIEPQRSIGISASTYFLRKSLRNKKSCVMVPTCPPLWHRFDSEKFQNATKARQQMTRYRLITKSIERKYSKNIKSHLTDAKNLEKIKYCVYVTKIKREDDGNYRFNVVMDLIH